MSHMAERGQRWGEQRSTKKGENGVNCLAAQSLCEAAFTALVALAADLTRTWSANVHKLPSDFWWGQRNTRLFALLHLSVVKGNFEIEPCKIILTRTTTVLITFFIKHFKMIIDGDGNHIKMNEWNNVQNTGFVLVTFGLLVKTNLSEIPEGLIHDNKEISWRQMPQTAAGQSPDQCGRKSPLLPVTKYSN